MDPGNQNFSKPDQRADVAGDPAIAALQAETFKGLVACPLAFTCIQFDTRDIGMDREQFLAELRPTFTSLPFDFYDVRKAHIELLQSREPEVSTTIQNQLQDYYRGTLSLEQLAKLYGDSFAALHDAICEIKPFRQRSTAQFDVQVLDDRTWQIEQVTVPAVAQDVEHSDLRSIPRVFPETVAATVELPAFQKLLHFVIAQSLHHSPETLEMSITVWHNRLVTTGGKSSNAPEGMHQDGADYIVSALVIERENVTGGCSKVYGADQTTEVLSVELQPGQGIFQSDQDSSLWHDVTPIELADAGKGPGWRSTIGFDVEIMKRRPGYLSQ